MASKREYWLGHVNRHRTSGQSAARYAADNDLDVRLFYSWIRKLKMRPNTPIRKNVGFVPVVPRTPGEPEIIIPIGPHVKIVINRDADLKEVLGKFLIALIG